MFPSKGTTVWVNVRDRPYLGKVLRTSPELDMVCVRISDYWDHLSRGAQHSESMSHSCPESNPTMLSGGPSTVVITCGLSDISPLDSPISHNFHRMCIDTEKEDLEINSRSESDLKCLDFHHNEEKSIPFQTDINLSRDIDNGDGDEDDDEDFSNSFEIDTILRDAIPNKRKISSEFKMWKCRYCHLYLKDEKEVFQHIVTEHKLESHIDADNWIVVGGLHGMDYEKVKYDDDQNIKFLNNIHLSSNSNRKRQFNELNSPDDGNHQGINGLRESSLQDSLEASVRSDIEPNFNNERSDDTTFPILNQIILNNRSMVTEIDRFPNTSLYNHLSNPSSRLSSQNSDCIDLKIRNDMLHHFLLKNNFHFPLTHSFPTSSCLPDRFRSNSLTTNYLGDQNVTVDNSMEHEPMFSAPKRTRIEGHIKKCRKMYGIEQRHMWCNQCKWKKACSRFCNDINTTI